MWAIQIDKQGGPEVMEWRELPDPKPGPGDLLVDVAAAGLNYIDTYHRSGLYQVAMPYTLGLEGAGTVIEVGADVTGYAVGDRVAWASAPGSYAEQAVVPARGVMKVPSDVSLEIAAAVAAAGDDRPLPHEGRLQAGGGGEGPDPRRRRRHRACC